MRNLERLHKGLFNTMQQVWQPDGSVKITLLVTGDSRAYHLRVQDLYGKNEQEVHIDTGKPIVKRNI